MPKASDILSLVTTGGRWRWLALGGVAAAALFLLVRGTRPDTGEALTFSARRGPLDITVLEGGSIQALESQELKCEVRVGYQGLKVLKIVEEGYQVTDDDVRTNKVLIELDSSELKKQIVQQDIQFESSSAALTDAQQNYEIQLNQNLSDIKAAEQKARFARMDFDKFLGEGVTQDIIARLGLEKQLASEQTNATAQAAAVTASLTTEPGQTGSTNAPPPGVPLSHEGLPGATTNQSPAQPIAAMSNGPALAPAAIDFSRYARIEALGVGEAKQKVRKFEDDLQVAKKELGQAESTLEGTRRLFEKGFVTKLDQERDDIACENSRLKVQTAETARDLFLRYDFSKSAEEFLSKYAEAVRELVRARKAAISKLAQAQAKLRSAQSQYNIQTAQRKEMYEQLEKCVMTAKKTGLVVYGGGRDDMGFGGGDERIREGATVRERQSIITIPDMTKMSVRVKIHESYIKKIRKGLKARITLDAFPDTVLEGEVSKVGVLPDSQNRWLNPDMKVYLTTIAINSTHDWLKPGMSAKVEIMVDRLSDVVYVPIQAVSATDDGQYCYVANGRTPKRQRVEIGEFNDEFIEIKKGLKEGERVLLRAPGGLEAEKAKPEPKAPENGKESPATKPTAPAGSTKAAKE